MDDETQKHEAVDYDNLSHYFEIVFDRSNLVVEFRFVNKSDGMKMAVVQEVDFPQLRTADGMAVIDDLIGIDVGTEQDQPLHAIRFDIDMEWMANFLSNVDKAFGTC